MLHFLCKWLYLFTILLSFQFYWHIQQLTFFDPPCINTPSTVWFWLTLLLLCIRVSQPGSIFERNFIFCRGIKTMFWQIQFQTTCVGISISLFSRFSLSIPRENCFKPKYLHSTDAQSSTAHKRDIVMTKTVFPAQHSILFEYITDALISLHWLRVPEHIIFKVATLMYRALHGSAPPYLASSFACNEGVE